MSSLPPSRLQRMVEIIDASWQISDVQPATGGVNDTYVLTVETDATTRQLALKLSNGRPEQVRAESRLLDLIDDSTELPVPTVLGAVDSHPGVPGPFFVMDRIQGEHLDPRVRGLRLKRLEPIVRQVGHHLGDLHSVDAFDMFGDIRLPADTHSSGGARPLAREHDLTLDSPLETWPDWLEEIALEQLHHHRETRFRDRTPRIRSELQRRIPRLEGPFSPSIGRIDHAFENLLVSPEGTGIRGFVDWGILRTVDPVYDLTCAEQSFCGTLLPGTERRARLKTALYDGYENRTDLTIRDDHREVYLLVNQVARQNWLSDWVTPDVEATVERRHRRFLDAVLSRP